MAVVDRMIVQSLIVQQLALAVGGTYTPTSAAAMRLTSNGIRDMIIAFDGQTVRNILLDPNNGARQGFILTAALANNALIPSHIGPIDAVRINGSPASLESLDLVRWTRANALAVPIDPYYSLQGSRIYHNGTSVNFGTLTADVDYCDYTADTSTYLCKAPSDYTVYEVAGCLAMLASVDGDDTPLATFYQGAAQSFASMTGRSAPALADLGQIMQQGASV